MVKSNWYKLKSFQFLCILFLLSVTSLYYLLVTSLSPFIISIKLCIVQPFYVIGPSYDKVHLHQGYRATMRRHFTSNGKPHPPCSKKYIYTFPKRPIFSSEKKNSHPSEKTDFLTKLFLPEKITNFL